jgi:DNA-binding IclR family transcriptional regulator
MLAATMRPVNHNVDTAGVRLEAAEGARAVSKAIALLRAFTPSRPWWTVSELVGATGFPHSTVTRLVSALETGGVLHREPGRYRYTIGHLALTWATVAKASTNLNTLAHPLLERLRDDTGESAAVFLKQGNTRVCLDVVVSNAEVLFMLRLGEVGPLTRGAAGRCIAANLPKAERAGLGFPPAELEMLERVGDFAGVVCTLNDRIKDAWAVSAPIRDADASIYAALVVGGPTSRFKRSLFAKYAPGVLQAANDISVMLGCPSDVISSHRRSFEGIPVFSSTSARMPQPGGRRTTSSLMSAAMASSE